MKKINLMYLLIFPIALLFFLAAKNAVPVRKSFKIKVLTILFLLIPFAQNIYSQWNSQTSGTSNQLNCLRFADSLKGYASGTNGTFLATTNEGTNWTTLSGGTTESINSMSFINSGTGWYACSNGVIKLTTGNGVSWIDNNSGTTENLSSIYMTSFATGWAVGANGTIRNTAGSFNWSGQTSGTTNGLNCVFFINSSTGWICGGGGTVLKTTNSGTNWLTQTTPVSTTLNGIYFKDSTGWAAGTNGIILKTVNGGTNWVQQTSGTSSIFNSIFFINLNAGWACATNGSVYGTVNGGTNWIQQTTPASSLNSVIFTNSTYGWAAGTNGSIVKTTNGGFTAPGAPTLISPANNSTGVSITPILQWFPVTGSQSYRLRIWSDSLLTALIFSDSTISTINYIIGTGVLQGNTRYYWRVNGVNPAGHGANSSIWNFTTTGVTGVSQSGNEIPNEFKLYNNYPNPFNPVTKINFDLPKQSYVKLTVYDITGREAETLINGILNAGVLNYDWDASGYSSGVYFYRITAGDFSDIKKMILIK